jgi:hypothetical protein
LSDKSHNSLVDFTLACASALQSRAGPVSGNGVWL